jgi:hypothetical protein
LEREHDQVKFFPPPTADIGIKPGLPSASGTRGPDWMQRAQNDGKER